MLEAYSTLDAYSVELERAFSSLPLLGLIASPFVERVRISAMEELSTDGRMEAAIGSS
jgi:hypothetical protein